MKQLSLYICLLLLTACQSTTRTLPINKNHHAVAQDSRVQYIILHYTAADFNRSLYLLTTQSVSSHYLINDQDGQIYQLVDENNRAWHAGVSSWQGRTSLNASSIGIEIVNNGYVDMPQGRVWFPYTEKQIQSLITLLKDIQTRYHLTPDQILGHSDIAPQRKQDPGPLFPWRRLAKEGLAIWPNEQAVANQKIIFDKQGMPPIKWIQQKLSEIGYAVPLTGLVDEETTKAITAFQMHFQPEHFDGVPNTKTAALLMVIIQKNFAIPQ